MSGDKQSFVLAHATARHLAIEAVRNAPDGCVVEVRPETRSLEQNAHLHALLGECAEKMTFCGIKLSRKRWKNILIIAHDIAEDRPVLMVNGIEGEIVNIRESSALMSVERASSLIEYIQAWIADNK